MTAFRIGNKYIFDKRVQGGEGMLRLTERRERGGGVDEADTSLMIRLTS
jgi:hypothetical protein